MNAAAALHLEGELSIFRAAELKPLMLEHARAGALFDLSAVSLLDTAGVQLLLLAARTAALSGRQLRLAAPSPAAQRVLALLGLDRRYCLDAGSGILP